jgi:hypothetical protein
MIEVEAVEIVQPTPVPTVTEPPKNPVAPQPEAPAAAFAPSAPVVEPVTEPETVEEAERVEEESPAVAANPYGWQFVAPKAPAPVEEPVEEVVLAEQPAPIFEVEPADPADDYVVPDVADEIPEAQPETTVAPAVAYEETPAAEDTDPIAEPPLSEVAPETTAEDVLTEEPDPVAYNAVDALSESDEDEIDGRADARAAVADDEMTVADYKLAARFSLCGNISRKMKTVKISSDVGRLAQLMHPGESLSTIVENALLSRIYVENRDAFDALAEMIEKKGGHIKC